MTSAMAVSGTSASMTLSLLEASKKKKKISAMKKTMAKKALASSKKMSSIKHAEDNPLKPESRILLFKDATSEEEAAAKRSSLDIASLKEIYFRYNLPLQVFLIYNIEGDPRSGIDPQRSWIMNWMPRKGVVEKMTFGQLFGSEAEVTPQVVEDFMRASAACLRNLGSQMLKLGWRKTDNVIYPNCEG